MTEALGLLRGFGAADAVLLPDAVDGEALIAQRFVGAAVEFAAMLAPHAYAINRCEHPARFMLASAAALVAGCTLVLPPSRSDAAQDLLAARYPGAIVLCDEGGANGAIAVPDPFCYRGLAVWPAPMIAADHVAAILFTSGSTGVPKPEAKRWSSLVRGAATFAGAFGPLRDVVIVGTVAPQHMFGLETTLVAPWQNGVPLAAARPLYAADLAAASARFAGEGRRLWLMTTPLHLRHFHATLSSPPSLDRIIVSTMPLPAALASDVERDWNVRVDEIYGCTEGGMLASRRTGASERFTPGPGLAFELAADGSAVVRGGQLDAPLVLADRFERTPDGSLLHRGRISDVVKIGGKRTSLAALDAALLSIPGVRDGAFVERDAGDARLSALVVAPSHHAASVRAALAQRVDRAFLPRPLVFVAKLPRDEQGKLSATAKRRALEDALAAQIARPDRTLVGSGTVSSDHPALPGHFPGDPCVPGVVLLERVERLLHAHGLGIAALRDVRFTQPIRPGTPFEIRVAVDDARAQFSVVAAATTAASGVFDWCAA